MADYGTECSLNGYNAGTCPDRFLVFSSKFQCLKVYNRYSITTTRPNTGSGITNIATATHSLGYFCPYIVIYNGATTPGTGTSYFFTDSDIPLITRGYTNRVEIDVDENFDFGTADGDTVYFTVYVFLDDFRAVSEANNNTGNVAIGTTNNDFGIAASKDGFDVKTCTDDQLSFSSSRFNSIIHKKGNTTSSSVSHNLGYIPNYLSYDNLAGGSSYISFTDPALNYITSSSLVFGSAATNYYVIFKDKLA